MHLYLLKNKTEWVNVVKNAIAKPDFVPGSMEQQSKSSSREAAAHQLFLQYFLRLTRISGTGAAYKDNRQAFMQQVASAQSAAAPWAAAPLPAELAPPSITIASMPAAASSQAMQQGQHLSLPAAGTCAQLACTPHTHTHTYTHIH